MYRLLCIETILYRYYAMLSFNIALQSAGFTVFSEVESSDQDYILEEEAPWPIAQSYLEKSSIAKYLNMSLSAVKKFSSPNYGDLKESKPLNLYLNCLDVLTKLLGSYDPQLLIEKCTTLLASDIHNIALFSLTFLRDLSECSSTPEILTVLFAYSTWFDHILVEYLVKICGSSKAVEVLQDFNAIASIEKNGMYCYPTPSHILVPSESSNFTVMATQYSLGSSVVQVQQISLIKSLVTHIGELTELSLLCLAKMDNPTTLYWLLPKTVVPVMHAKMYDNLELLYNEGILEIAVYPGFIYVTDSSVSIGSLKFLDFDVS